MRKTATPADGLNTLVAALRSGCCDEAAARRLYTLGPEAVTLALLDAAVQHSCPVNVTRWTGMFSG